MNPDPYALPPYRAIRFIVAYGTRLAILTGLALALAGIYLTATGAGLLPALLGVGAGVVLAGVLASYVEVLQVISETLMSR